MKQLLLGNHAVARGAYEAGCAFVSSYPGTPSTEVTEYISQFSEVYSEWAPNEKVAMEAALGASIGGARSLTAMKHVGLNVAADPLFTASYTGVNGGMVIVVADDPGMHSSQNEQDSRHYAIGAKLLMLEPSDSKECLEFTKAAFELSEKFDTPVFLRLSTRISHSQSKVELSPRQQVALREYTKNPAKYVMMPGNAKGRHVVVEERQQELAAWSEYCDLNQITWGDRSIGIITSGAAYQYAKEALPNASFLKLGVVNPLPSRLITEFARQVETLYVIEELDPVIEQHCKALGLAVKGKECFSLLGEYSQRTIAKGILGKEAQSVSLSEPLPVRPPAMCPGCPHRGMFYTLHKMGLTVFGDIGCYTLGATPPLSAMDTTVCMGASISAMHGFQKARGQESAGKSVAVIGDSTFIHSGITGLIDITYNKGISTVIVSDNSITGMTGHQDNPTTGKTITGEPTYQVSIEAVCQAAGVKRVTVVDPNDLPRLEQVLTTELAIAEPSVIITRRPCILLKGVQKHPPYRIDKDQCKGCRACMKLGCPAIVWGADKKAAIDSTLCVGCDLCTQMCAFGAIHPQEEKQA